MSDFDPTKPWGIHEDQLRKERVDNGARERSDWWTHWFRIADGKQVCGSYVQGGKTGRKYPQNLGRRCDKSKSNARIYPNGRCKKHGGANPGVAVSTGRYMQLRGPLKDADERAEANRDLLDLRRHLALFDIRLEELSGRVDAGAGTPEQWKRAREHWRAYQKALRAEDKGKQDYHAKELGLLLDATQRSEKAWDEIIKLTERRMVRTERAQALLIQGAQMVASTDLKWVMRRLVDIVQEEAHGTAAVRILDRLDSECLVRITPSHKAEARSAESRELLPGVPGKGTGLREGDPGGRAPGRRSERSWRACSRTRS